MTDIIKKTNGAIGHPADLRRAALETAAGIMERGAVAESRRALKGAN